FAQRHPRNASGCLRRLGLGLAGPSIAGPRSRELLAHLTDADVSDGALRFLDHRSLDVANTPALINRVTYTGDLGYEVWVAPEYLRRLYLAIADAGRDFGLVHFGMRALLSLRLEKNFPTWYRELRPIYGPFEAALERFVELSKSDFIGREAALRAKESGGQRRRGTFVGHAPDLRAGGGVCGWLDGQER